MDNKSHPPRRLDFSGVVPGSILQTIVIDIVFPYMLYQLLIGHVPLLFAFALAALLPLANSIRTAFVLHMLDLIGVLALYVIIWMFLNAMVQSDLSIVSVLLTYVLPIGVLGLVILCSRLFARPLFFYIERYYHIRASGTAISDDYWQTKNVYRHAIYRLNVVWGSGQVMLAAIILLLFVFLSAEFFGMCALIVMCLFYILLTMWSVYYIDRKSQQWNIVDLNEVRAKSSLTPGHDF
jgi:hypothetical protein